MKLDSSEYKLERKRLDELYRIMRNSDLYKPEVEAYEFILLEQSFLCSNRRAAIAVAEEAAQWFVDKNPYHFFLALKLCGQLDIELGPMLQKLAVNVSEALLDGSPAGTLQQLDKRKRKNQALILMSNLVYFGESLANAASRAANWHGKMKASSL